MLNLAVWLEDRYDNLSFLSFQLYFKKPLGGALLTPHAAADIMDDYSWSDPLKFLTDLIRESGEAWAEAPLFPRIVLFLTVLGTILGMVGPSLAALGNRVITDLSAL